MTAKLGFHWICLHSCRRHEIWPRDTKPFFPATLLAMPTNMGKKCLTNETTQTRDYLRFVIDSIREEVWMSIRSMWGNTSSVVYKNIHAYKHRAKLLSTMAQGRPNTLISQKILNFKDFRIRHHASSSLNCIQLTCVQSRRESFGITVTDGKADQK